MIYIYNMSYVITIPSYDRADTLLTQTLSTLLRQDINPKKINIFVANKDEAIIYKNHIPSKYYNKIIIGVKGLYHQTNFIKKYYPEGTKIIQIQDDIKSIFIKKGSNDSEEINLDKFFNYAFELLNEYGLKIWGLNKVSNPFFMTDNITTDLRLIEGVIYGFINSYDKAYNNLLVDNYTAEDIERTLRYYITDGGVMRFNFIGYKTIYQAKGGIQSDLGSNKKRLMMVKEATIKLNKLYKGYGKIKEHKDQEYIFELYKNPKLTI